MRIPMQHENEVGVSCSNNVIQKDTTFNVEKGDDKLVAFCYLNSTSNKTEISPLALIVNEGEGNFNFLLSKFKKETDNYIFLVDKYFNSNDCLKKIFCNVTVKWCCVYFTS